MQMTVLLPDQPCGRHAKRHQVVDQTIEQQRSEDIAMVIGRTCTEYRRFEYANAAWRMAEHAQHCAAQHDHYKSDQTRCQTGGQKEIERTQRSAGFDQTYAQGVLSGRCV